MKKIVMLCNMYAARVRGEKKPRSLSSAKVQKSLQSDKSRS